MNCPSRNSLAQSLKVLGLAVLCGLALVDVSDAAITSYNIQIDSSTTQPVGTGFIPTTAGDHVLIIAEGALQPFPSSSRVENGWIGPDGTTRLQRVGQPVTDGMPYGALISGTGSISSFQFLGSYGSSTVQSGEVGSEFKLALNMDDDDLLACEGTVSITLVHIPAGDPNVVKTILDSSSGSVVGTGLIAEAGEKFMVLAYGAGKGFGSTRLNEAWFTAAGEIDFNRVGQLYPQGPYGGLYGSLTGGSTGFYIGEAGSWQAQSADNGDELSLALNMSAADAAAMEGRFVVFTIRIPNAASSAPDQNGGFESSIQSFPNPMTEDARIRFSLPADESVRLRIYDTSGRWVRNLVDDSYSVGEHEVAWDGRSDAGEKVSSGTYFYQLSTSEGSKTGRLIVTR